MAKRNRTYQTEKTKDKIKATQLLNRVQAYALGEKIRGKPVDLTSGELKASLHLIDKVYPNLQSIEQRNIDEYEGKDETTLTNELAQLLMKNPEIVKAILNDKPELIQQLANVPESRVIQ